MQENGANEDENDYDDEDDEDDYDDEDDEDDEDNEDDDDVQEVGRSEELLKSTFKVLINQVLENGGSICACTFSQLTHFIFTGVSKVLNGNRMLLLCFCISWRVHTAFFLSYRHYFTPNLYEFSEFTVTSFLTISLAFFIFCSAR